VIRLANSDREIACCAPLVADDPAKADSYRFCFAIYVRQRTWITPFYIGLIDPFGKWIVYPAMLEIIRATWDQNS
jgi:hypothetical protein